MITWATLTDGVLGAVIGGVVVFAAAIFTLWQTRSADMRREQARRREGDVRLRRQHVVEVIEIFRELERETRMPVFLYGRSQAAFLRATMLFHMAERADHPHVTRWLLQQCDVFKEKSDAWHRVWWCPLVGRRRLSDLGTYLGEVVGVLVFWAADELGDDLFDDPGASPNQVAAGAITPVAP